MPSHRNHTLLVAIAFLQGFVFYGPIATIYRQTFGLDLSELFVIESIFWVLTLLLEMPWGLIADRIGYRATLILGNFIFFASKLVFAAASGFRGFLAERIILAFAISALSGCSDALLYRSAGPEQAPKAFGSLRAWGVAGIFSASLAFPLFSSLSPRIAAYATIPPYALAALLSFFLVDISEGPIAPERVAAKDEGGGLPSLVSTMKRVLSDRKLLLLILAAAAAGEASQAATVFLAPLQLDRAGLPRPAFGAVFAALQASGFAAAGAGPLTSALGRPRLFRGLLVIEAAALAVLALTESAQASVAALIMIAASAALFAPVSVAAQNDRVSIKERATALSANAVVAELAAAGMNVAVGGAARAGLPLCFAGLGLCLAAALLIPKDALL
jgi:predicted MFS family arabinose efflux permease